MVVIKEFEMPKCCSDCTLNSCFNWEHYCNVTLQEVDFEAETRPANCPLVEEEKCKNGDILLSMFDTATVYGIDKENDYITICIDNNFYQKFRYSWWNTSYKG